MLIRDDYPEQSARTTRRHIDVLRAKEACHIADLKQQHESCTTCAHRLRQQYMDYCKVKRRHVHKYNICEKHKPVYVQQQSSPPEKGTP